MDAADSNPQSVLKGSSQVFRPMRSTGLYALKPRFVERLEPVADALAARGTSPTAVTMTAIPLALLTAVALTAGFERPAVWLAVPVLAVTLMAVNALDGHLARTTDDSSYLGGAANELVDRVSDLLLIGSGFLLVSPLLAAVALGTVLTAEMVALIGWGSTGDRSLIGVMGKPDRALLLSVGAVISFLIGPETFSIVFVVLAVGSVMTTGQRIGHVVRRARHLDRERMR